MYGLQHHFPLLPRFSIRRHHNTCCVQRQTKGTSPSNLVWTHRISPVPSCTIAQQSIRGSFQRTKQPIHSRPFIHPRVLVEVISLPSPHSSSPPHILGFNWPIQSKGTEWHQEKGNIWTCCCRKTVNGCPLLLNGISFLHSILYGWCSRVASVSLESFMHWLLFK